MGEIRWIFQSEGMLCCWMHTENRWWRGVVRAMEQCFNRSGPMLSRPRALVGSNDCRALKMSDSVISMSLRVFSVTGGGSSEMGGRT